MMRLSRLSLALVATTALVALTATTATAQLKLPAPSPLARVMQTVGVTEVTVEYSSPGLKGRKVFGTLVEWDKLWRTGANAATKITFSTDAKVAGQDVPAGTYAVFTIPGKKKWTIILNKDAEQGGTRKYDEKLDQVRFEAKPDRLKHGTERMTFVFADTTDDASNLYLVWGKTRVTLPITVDTAALAKANIEGAHRSAWRELASGARYLKDRGDAAGARKLIDASVSIHEDFYNAFVKAQIHKDAGDIPGARQWAQKAWDLGEKAEYFFWKDQVAKALAEWK